ncbi:hypothetical protein Goari_014447 [Gossypium aridum]|uniref:Uncharacterized protein n=1 Tax=Gossypium aridum TaxID=34290 RepID=A0A7J8XI54_GOSAI|nr:hypothetical protein [Gossypium aridum]
MVLFNELSMNIYRWFVFLANVMAMQRRFFRNQYPVQKHITKSYLLVRKFRQMIQ